MSVLNGMQMVGVGGWGRVGGQLMPITENVPDTGE